MQNFAPSPLLNSIISEVREGGLPTADEIKNFSDEQKNELFEQQKIIIFKFRQVAKTQVDELQDKLSLVNTVKKSTCGSFEEEENSILSDNDSSTKSSIADSSGQNSFTKSGNSLSKSDNFFTQKFPHHVRSKTSFKPIDITNQKAIVHSHFVGKQAGGYKPKPSYLRSSDYLRTDPRIAKIEKELRDLRRQYRTTAMIIDKSCK
ncbi:hypothetical protein TRFO_22813 [Tritrichomonas foetus]|uniref:Uncharacterized protein n=1 Tax=Tritrichomonas foetus TaxID=1144522 RepID=A0A1J4KCC0_9EUKA|nr:hypothetical protein TRFO_22813 [Tritrichomonas foetus]|eukprot:OHT08626.1 hypothetical protein TRFO_22813 [Tritrichomonas foetus]